MKAVIKRRIEILFSDRCPYVGVAIQRVLSALEARRPEHDIELRLVRVDSLVDAARYRFWGSLAIRVDGRDVLSA